MVLLEVWLEQLFCIEFSDLGAISKCAERDKHQVRQEVNVKGKLGAAQSLLVSQYNEMSIMKCCHLENLRLQEKEPMIALKLWCSPHKDFQRLYPNPGTCLHWSRRAGSFIRSHKYSKGVLFRGHINVVGAVHVLDLDAECGLIYYLKLQKSRCSSKGKVCVLLYIICLLCMSTKHQ